MHFDGPGDGTLAQTLAQLRELVPTHRISKWPCSSGVVINACWLRCQAASTQGATTCFSLSRTAMLDVRWRTDAGVTGRTVSIGLR